MDDQMTKARLLDKMREGRAHLEALVSSVPRDRMTERGAPSEWSVKDVLAHLSSWDRYLLAWLEADARGQRPNLPEPSAFSEAGVDQFNAANVALHRDEPLADVLSEFDVSFRALYAAAESLPEDALLDPNRFAWAGGKPLYFYFAVNSYAHYEEHLEQLGARAG